MFKGISPVIAIILLVGVTVGSIITAYIGINSLTDDIKDNTEKSIIKEFDARGADLKVDVFGNCKIYLRNTGTKDIPMEAISFYIDDKPVNYKSSTGIIKTKNTTEINFSDLGYGTHDLKIKLKGNLLEQGSMVCSATPKTCAQLNGVCCNPNPCLSGKILWASDCSECCANLSDCFVPECIINSDCNDSDSCTKDICSGGLCSNPQITTCENNDGCCPPNCTSINDNDCVPECTTNSECADGDSCTKDICSGGLCSNPQITTCENNDGCCPAGCNHTNDNDCVDPNSCESKYGVCCGPNQACGCISGELCEQTEIPNASDCSLCCSIRCITPCDFEVSYVALTNYTVGSTAHIKARVKSVGVGTCHQNLELNFVLANNHFCDINQIIGESITIPVNLPPGSSIDILSPSEWNVTSGNYCISSQANPHTSDGNFTNDRAYSEFTIN